MPILSSPQSFQRLSIPALNGLAAKVALLSLLCWTHGSDLKWMLQTSAPQTDKIALLIGGVFLPAYIFRHVKIYSPVYWAKPALALLAIAGTVGAANALSAGLPQLGAMALILSLFSWLGLNRGAWPQWRGQLKFALLLAFALVFYLEFSSGFGFALRLATAEIVQGFLKIFGIDGVSSQDVVVVENAIAHIDTPCSGLKSLWVGSGFFLALLILFDAAIGMRVVATYGLTLVLLFYANVFRVTILVVLNSVLFLPRAAELVHVPLGVLGFCVACGLVFLTFKYWPPQKSNQVSPAEILAHPAIKLVAAVVVTAPMLVLAATDTASEKASSPPRLLARMEPSVALEPLPLSSGEQKYFARGLSTIAAKYQWRAAGVQGSALVVQSRDFNMFHAPELCMAANGVKIDFTRTLAWGPDRRIRVMSLNDGRATGVYWLQTGGDVIDGFGERFWRYLWFGEKDWTMISMVVDPAPTSDRDLIENFVAPFYAATKASSDRIAFDPRL